MTPTEAGSGRQAIVLAVVLSPDGQRVLLARRPDHAHQGGLWEFPGGKQQAGETVEECLARELQEECGIRVSHSLPLLSFRYDYPDRQLYFDARVVDEWTGQAHGREGQELEWRDAGSLTETDFPPANAPLLRALALPEIYFITPDLGDYGTAFLEGIERLLDSGIRMLRLRSRDLAGEGRRKIALEIKAECRRYDCRFLYDGSPGEVMHLAADGLHLTTNQLMTLRERPLDKSYIVAASCHDKRELAAAAALDVDFCVLSPVLPTDSHPERRPLGWSGFAGLAAAAEIPVYALGGLHREDLPTARMNHARGIAMISGLWKTVARP